ncbi:MAG: 3-dehydroquinate dehydratase [Rhizobiales bacterium]|nr:3-dehydroquinate dehydratase [Hyphomicrobiales bacterium]
MTKIGPKASGKTIFVLNGPNLNLLGTREPQVYGRSTLKDVEALCRETAAGHRFTIEFRQSNHEGDILDWLHEAGAKGAAGVVLNPGGLTHTSVYIHAREPWGSHSTVSPAAKAVLCGFGVAGYALAINGIATMAGRKDPR